jgi:hypothetical protein
MPNADNGYYDTMLEIGYAGLAFLVVFILATLHAIGGVADRDPRRARLVLSLVLFIILYNYFEGYWMRGFELLAGCGKSPPLACLYLRLVCPCPRWAIYLVSLNYGTDFFRSLLGVVFVIVAAEIGRYWRPFPLREAEYGSRSPRAGSPGPLPGARSPWLRIQLS